MLREFFGSKIEILDEEKAKWNEAFLADDGFWDQRVYATLLQVKNDPSIRVYGQMLFSRHGGARVDIPLSDPTPRDVIAERAYLETTEFGMVNEDAFRKFSTNIYMRDHILALLNRQSSGMDEDHISDWFYKKFQTFLLERKGKVYMGSHGGMGKYGYDYNVTIDSAERQWLNRDVKLDEVDLDGIALFTELVHRSFPHINIEPLPSATYFKHAQEALKFLPEDWGK